MKNLVGDLRNPFDQITLNRAIQRLNDSPGNPKPVTLLNAALGDHCFLLTDEGLYLGREAFGKWVAFMRSQGDDDAQQIVDESIAASCRDHNEMN